MAAQLSTSLGVLFLIGAVLILLAHWINGADRARMRSDWIKFFVYFAIVTGSLVAGYAGRSVMAVLIAMVSIIGAIETQRCLNDRKVLSVSLSLLVFCGVAFGLTHLLFLGKKVWYPSFAFLFVLVAMNDSFAQLFGRLLGRHQLCSRVSPQKTLEGMIGGVAASLAGAFAFSFLLPRVSAAELICLALVVSAAGTGGDLMFSGLKRWLGAKDFSSLIPGHGGVLDRFDSLVVAAPAFYWSQRVLLN